MNHFQPVTQLVYGHCSFQAAVHAVCSPAHWQSAYGKRSSVLPAGGGKGQAVLRYLCNNLGLSNSPLGFLPHLLHWQMYTNRVFTCSGLFQDSGLSWIYILQFRVVQITHSICHLLYQSSALKSDLSWQALLPTRHWHAAQALGLLVGSPAAQSFNFSKQFTFTCIFSVLL